MKTIKLSSDRQQVCDTSDTLSSFNIYNNPDSAYIVEDITERYVEDVSDTVTPVDSLEFLLGQALLNKWSNGFIDDELYNSLPTETKQRVIDNFSVYRG